MGSVRFRLSTGKNGTKRGQMANYYTPKYSHTHRYIYILKHIHTKNIYIYNSYKSIELSAGFILATAFHMRDSATQKQKNQGIILRGFSNARNAAQKKSRAVSAPAHAILCSRCKMPEATRLFQSRQKKQLEQNLSFVS